MAGLNLLAAIVIYWNTAHLGEAARPRKHAGLTVEPELLAHNLTPWVGPHPAHRRIPVANPVSWETDCELLALPLLRLRREN